VAIVPARVRKPRDKPTAENAVRLVEMWVLAPLRHRQLFSLAEANAALAERVEASNNRPFAPPREGSRRALFEAIKRSKLKPLPAEPFVIGQWLTARVNIDYHIAPGLRRGRLDGHFYSVPCRLVHQRVDVFLTATAVAVFHNGERVASHLRSTAKARHTTASEHMPPAHQAMARRTPDRLRIEAAALGLAIGTYADRLLGGREHPEQGVRACLGVLRLAGAYGKNRLELACERALAKPAPAKAGGSCRRVMSSACSKPIGSDPSTTAVRNKASASTPICAARLTTTDAERPGIYVT
jgi:hypothetical protein